MQQDFERNKRLKSLVVGNEREVDRMMMRLMMMVQQ